MNPAMSIIQRISHHLPAQVIETYRTLKFKYGFRRGKRTWSQEGEDLIIRRICPERHGFYVDIGAHHPYRYSNTCYLSRRGWYGINVDPLPEAIELFRKARPRDINLNVGVSLAGGVMRYFRFNDSAYNTFDEALADETRRRSDGIVSLGVIKVRTLPLAELLEQHMPADTSIDVMNIDAEGLDLDVLKSNDWTRFRPRIILAEVQWQSIEDLLATELYAFMTALGYGLYAKCVNTSIFRMTQSDRTTSEP